ncbi:MAG: photosystem P840 reaction-center cytochrome c-551 [Deferrisomatales bacterium]|nr:photosystem P840 reaction-center cytochrome c-551 [Deferrisomatales bacterium]
MSRFVLALLLAAVFVGGPATAYDQAAAEKLFQKHCATCHHLDRALKKNKDRAGWDKTVKRMQGYASGMFTDGAAESIVEYLTRVRGPKD